MADGKHKGVREFTGEEISNIAVGQSGFDILDAGTHTASSKGINYWIAIKSVVSGGTSCKAKKYPNVPGDDLSTNGNYSTGSNLTIDHGDIVYGAFDEVLVGVGDYLIAYRGR